MNSIQNENSLKMKIKSIDLDDKKVERKFGKLIITHVF